jgi:hypothetical protein
VPTAEQRRMSQRTRQAYMRLTTPAAPANSYHQQVTSGPSTPASCQQTEGAPPVEGALDPWGGRKRITSGSELIRMYQARLTCMDQ